MRRAILAIYLLALPAAADVDPTCVNAVQAPLVDCEADDCKVCTQPSVDGPSDAIVTCRVEFEGQSVSLGPGVVGSSFPIAFPERPAGVLLSVDVYCSVSGWVGSQSLGIQVDPPDAPPPPEPEPSLGCTVRDCTLAEGCGVMVVCADGTSEPLFDGKPGPAGEDATPCADYRFRVHDRYIALECASP